MMGFWSKRAARFGADRSGSSAVEFALVAPVFILALVGLTEVGFAINTHATLNQIAENGARHLLFAPDDRNGATNKMIAETSGTTLTKADLTVSYANKTTPYPYVEVTLNYVFRPIGPFPLPSGINMTARASAPIAQ